MLIIVGSIIVFLAAMGGFMIAGGNPLILLHISEFVTIGGISAGVLITASPKTVLMRIVADTKACLASKGGSPEEFLDLMKLLYEVFLLGRKSGLIALDEHVSDPKSSTIFTKYHSFLEDEEKVAFLVNALRPIIDGKIKPEQLEGILHAELHSKEEEAEAGIEMLHLVGDSLPGIGIVAAVLGIINTMGSIAAGPEKVGESVAAALTGTFLGIFAAYGFINPLATRISFYHKSEHLYFNTISRAVSAFAKGMAPVMAIEIARRSLDKNLQPSASELEAILKTL